MSKTWEEFKLDEIERDLDNIQSYRFLSVLELYHKLGAYIGKWSQYDCYRQGWYKGKAMTRSDYYELVYPGENHTLMFIDDLMRDSYLFDD